MYPSGYKEDKIYSLKPTNGTGDLNFSRASSATRVNEQGLIETPSIIGSELIVNGHFTSGTTGWTPYSSATLNNSGSALNIVGAGTENGRATSPFTTVIGGLYHVTIDVVSVGSISTIIGITNSPNGDSAYVNSSAITTQTSVDFYFTATATTTYVVFKRTGSVDGDTNIYDNVSVKELITSNIPRIDYSNGCGSLLLEGQRTNLFPHSSDYNQTDWSKFNITIELNSTISPDGTLNASKVLEQVASANGHFMFDNLGLSINTEYNFSVFVKKLNRRYVAIQNSYNTANGSIAFFDLDTETLVYTYSAGTVGTFIVSDAKIEKYPNGWYRLSANFQSDAAGGFLPSLVLANSQWSTGFSYNNTYTGDVTKGIYVWGAQVEQGSYATSYIPTSGTTVTRLADTSATTGLSDVINSTEGVLYAEIAALADDGTSRQFSLSDGSSANNKISIIYTTTTNQIQAFVRASGSISFNETFTLSSATSSNKIAIKWKLNDFALWVNGVEVDTDISGNAPIGLSKLSFDDADGASNFYGNVQNLQIFKTALTDAELATLTTI
tara:strand:+ start:31 stop:1692 length:1662 start_codon:yes stop_codon:yes gene_type:complete